MMFCGSVFCAPGDGMIFVYYIFGGLTLISLGFNIWQWIAGRRFPLHEPVPTAETLPGVSILKPLKGVDEHTEECLRSWIEQDYPEDLQILFGVKDENDSVCGVVRGLIDEFPERDLELVFCPESLGANPKVSTLVQLERLIGKSRLMSPDSRNAPGGRSSDLPDLAVVVSDADVKVSPGYLKEAMTVLQGENMGLVFSFYRAANPMNKSMWIEAVAVNCDFWSQVCLAKRVRPIDFALGAAMSLRVETLKQLGGFEKLKDYVADDNRLGSMIEESGAEVAITNTVVDCYSHTMNFKEVWDHQLRWARTMRVCEPLPFFFSLITNALVWSLAWVIVSAFPGLGWQLYSAIGGLAAYVIVRLATTYSNGKKLTQARMPLWKVVQVLDVRDALGFLWWMFAFGGRKIEWRGKRYRVHRGGRLTPVG